MYAMEKELKPRTAPFMPENSPTNARTHTRTFMYVCVCVGS